MSCRAVRLSMARRSRWAAICTFLALSGCAALGPNYEAPKLSETDVPSRWTSPTEPADKTTDKARITGVAQTSTPRWWTELSDPVLDQLVDAAFSSSPTLEAAMAKLRQSQSYYSQAKASGAPSVDGGAASERAASDSTGNPSNESWLSMNSSWELDLFGAVRRG